MSLESDLYAPVKALLEGQGYSVKGEVLGCDVVAVRGKELPVIVELKQTFGIGLVLQGVKKPHECPAFGARCTPEHPLGATMVSNEGACAAYYRYRRTA